MAHFTRPDATAREECISNWCLPMRGSSHSAFTEMRFQWRSQSERDPRYRRVRLPAGFVMVDNPESDWVEIRDSNGYPRAAAKRPTDHSPNPIIVPIRRYEPSCESTGNGWKMVIKEWNQPVMRGDVFEDEASAHASAVEWLNEKKPGWEGYTTRVNFRGRPPKWNFFE
jgi:hypothetical protein